MRFFKNFCRKTCKSEKSPIQFVFSFGGIAQLVEHLHGMQGVSGSNPLTSTTKRDCHRSPSSRGLGHDPFTVGTGVRIPVGTPSLRSSRTVAFLLSTAWSGMDDEAIFCTDGLIFEKLNPAFLSEVFENFHKRFHFFRCPNR